MFPLFEDIVLWCMQFNEGAGKMMSKERRTLLITTFICFMFIACLYIVYCCLPRTENGSAKFIFKYALCWRYRYKCSFKILY